VPHDNVSALRASRRELLRTLAIGSASLLVDRHAVFGQDRRNLAGTGRVDVHFHLGGNAGFGGGGNTALISAAANKSVEDLDRAGTAAGIISASSSGAGTGSLADRNRQAREFNDTAARWISDHPTRFGLWTRLPLTDVDASLKEIEYGIDQLKADGIGLVTSYEDAWLGDPKLKPVFQELNRRKAVVYVHPNDAACCGGANSLSYEKLNPPTGGSWLEYPMNTARTIFSLMMGGTIRAYPDVRFIFSHGGGVTPLLLSRIEGFANWSSVGPEKLKQMFPDGITNEFRKLYFEVAQAFSKVNMDALMALVPTSHILYGSDYPVFPADNSAKGLAKLELPANVRRAIDRENVAALLPRWKA
jgi:predicted TIM-barrel fold metal-dependent hydrolase